MTKVEIGEVIPQEKPGIYVGWDQYGISRDSLWTDGIGSCLAIVLYEPKTKLRALAHISGTTIPKVPESVHPENVADTLISQFGDYKTIEAVLAGEDISAGNQKKMSDLVRRNLSHLKIPIIGEDLGNFASYRGRELHLNCRTGKVTIYRLPSLF